MRHAESGGSGEPGLPGYRVGGSAPLEDRGLQKRLLRFGEDPAAGHGPLEQGDGAVGGEAFLAEHTDERPQSASSRSGDFQLPRGDLANG